MQVSQSFPGIIVPQRWSQSIQNIAMMCSDADVVSKEMRYAIRFSCCGKKDVVYFLVLCFLLRCLADKSLDDKESHQG